MTGGSVFSLSPSLLSACPPRLTVFDNWGCIVNTQWWGHDGGAGRVVGRVVMVMVVIMVTLMMEVAVKVTLVLAVVMVLVVVVLVVVVV